VGSTRATAAQGKRPRLSLWGWGCIEAVWPTSCTGHWQGQGEKPRPGLDSVVLNAPRKGSEAGGSRYTIQGASLEPRPGVIPLKSRGVDAGADPMVRASFPRGKRIGTNKSSVFAARRKTPRPHRKGRGLIDKLEKGSCSALRGQKVRGHIQPYEGGVKGCGK